MDVFPWLYLNDDLRPHVLKYLTVKQLVAIERVNKKLRGDVQEALLKVTKLAILEPHGFLYVGFCCILEHQFDMRDTGKVSLQSQAALIRKLPNLVAISIDPQVGPGVIAALSKCSQLRHVAIRNTKNVNSKKLDMTNLECTSFRVSKLDPVTCKNMKYIVGPLSESNLEMLLKNGLLGIMSEDFVSNDCRRLIFDHGHQLNILFIQPFSLSAFELDRFNNDFVDLRQTCILGSQLPDITFGHRLEKLGVVIDNDIGQLLADVKARCPNLIDLRLFGVAKLINVTPDILHENIRFLYIKHLDTNEESLRALLNGFNFINFILTTISDYSMPDVEVWNWFKSVQADFPKMFGLRYIHGINDKPESDNE